MDPLSYARHLEGELDDHFEGAFNGMALKREAGTMIRTDPVRDQADPTTSHTLGREQGYG